MPEKNNQSEASNKSKFFASSAHLLLLIVILLILIIAAAYVKQHHDQSSNTATKTTTASEQPSISLTSSEEAPENNSNFTVTVWENSYGDNVNAVQTSINYPTDKLSLVGFDNSNTAFEIQAQANDQSGMIIIARGHKGNLTGRQVVTKLNFKVKSAGDAQIKLADGTYLVDAASNQNILKQTSGLNITIGSKP